MASLLRLPDSFIAMFHLLILPTEHSTVFRLRIVQHCRGGR